MGPERKQYVQLSLAEFMLEKKKATLMSEWPFVERSGKPFRVCSEF